MNNKTMENLDRGDIIIHKSGGLSLVVTANYGKRVTAVTTADITNPTEWDLILKASYVRSDICK